MPPDRSTSSTPVGSHPPGQPLHASHSQSNSHSNSHSHSQQQQQQQQQHQKPHGSRTGRGPPPAETSIKLLSKIPNILPHERVFPIQIGSELFQLSGASISSDAPSYFSQYFLCQLTSAADNGVDPSTAIRTLYIDRDPVTFKDISLHLQGYHVAPRDGTHFVRLFADAQFYSLPRLISQLYEESIFMSIGHREFQIPRDLFSDPGNSPNFFSLGFAIFFSDRGDLFPGLDREGLIRPPSILPPSVPGRSADTFAELLHLLRGYQVPIRSDEHRASLLRDCRYFNFKGLEQRLIPHALSFNQARGRDEIVLRIQDILKSGISVLPDPLPLAALPGADPAGAWVNYTRPFVDASAAELVLEIGGENQRLHFSGIDSNSSGGGGQHQHQQHQQGPGTRVEFFRDARTRLTKLFEVIASKLNLPPTTQPLGLLMASGGAASQPATPGNTPLSDDWVKCVLENETAITLDGRRYTGHHSSMQEAGNGEEYEPTRRTTMMTMTPSATATAAATTAAAGAGFAASSSSMPGGAGGPGLDAPTGFSGLSLNPPKKRRRVDTGLNGMGGPPQSGYWTLKTGQWRLRIQSAKNGRSSVECVLVAVKLDAMSGEHARNEARGFLNG